MATNCKFQKTQYQVSYDSGATWQDVVPVQYGKGELIEYDSVDCTSINTLYRWRTLDGQYICDGNNKYVKEIREESYDNGVTWYVSYPTVYQQGSYVGVDTNFCCTKFVGHYEISKDAPDGCPSYYKWNGYRCVYIDPLKVIKCDGTTTLTSADTKYYQSGYTIVDAEIGESITAIGAKGFYGCSGLTNIDMPSGLTVIGSYAFQHCSGLTSVEMPSSIRTISASAFYNCNSLTSITVNATTPPALGANAFLSTNNCPIYVPCTQVNVYRTSSVWSTYASRIQGIPPCDEPTPTGDTKFKAYYSNGTSYTAACDSSLTITSADTNPSGYQYSAMTNGEIGYCVTTIGSNTFWNCTNISSITIANSVSTIEFNAFANCRNLINIDIPDSVTSIGDYAFSSCYSLTSVTIPSDIISIGSGAFNDCHSITNVTIPDSITTIAQWTFGNCWELSNVTIPKNLNSIGEFAFYDCHITNITLPSSLTRIGERAFASCRYLTELIIYATTPPTIVFSILEDTPIASNTGFIYVPSASVNRYKTASGWSKYASRIQAIP